MNIERQILVKLIEQVIDSMRETNTITDSDEYETGKYLITSDNNLSSLDAININSVDYVVSDVTETTFVIEAETGLTFNNEVWKALAPYYMYGVPNEIVKRLNKKNNGKYMYMKYPLICLFQPFDQNHPADLSGIYATANPELAFVNFTKKEIYADERYDYNYINTLYPLYYDFLKKYNASGLFNVTGNNVFDHTLSERLYYGETGSQGNTANKFNDPLDAILLNSTNIIIKENRCNFLNN